LIVVFLCREQQNAELPPFGRYATGIVYLDKTHHQESEAAFAQLAEECQLQVGTLTV
jgi:glutamate synthase (NADPH/NADH)